MKTIKKTLYVTQFLLLFLIPVGATAQNGYSLKVEPFGFHNEDGKIKVFQLYNLQFSIRNKADKNWFLEIQPGIIFNGVTPNIGLFLGGAFSKIYLKTGVLYYLSISGGGRSGSSIANGFTPCFGAGILVSQNVYAEVSYSFVFATAGVGFCL